MIDPSPSYRPRVVQCCIAKFHHFDLARQLDSRGLLATIYTGYPWWKLREEGLPREKVRTFPWLQTAYMGKGRFGLTHPWLDRELAWWAHETLDNYCARTVPDCDVLVGLSGSGLRAGRVVQSRGGRFVCDRGSAHIRTQEDLLREEHRRWDVPFRGIDPRSLEKEEAEYAAADAITVPSSFARSGFIARGVDPAKVHRIPYGVDLSRFRKCGEPTAGTFEVLFVGAVSIQKGVPYLMEAFSRVRHPAKRLRMVGAVQPCMARLLDRFSREGVDFLGPLPQNQLPSIMSSSRVLVLPSIQDGFGMVLAQALACGCPVVASEHTGGRDLFEDGVEGFIVPIRDVPGLTVRLQQLADERGLWERMSGAALRRVALLGGWRDYGAAWANLCLNLNAAGRPGTPPRE